MARRNDFIRGDNLMIHSFQFVNGNFPSNFLWNCTCARARAPSYDLERSKPERLDFHGTMVCLYELIAPPLSMTRTLA